SEAGRLHGGHGVGGRPLGGSGVAPAEPAAKLPRVPLPGRLPHARRRRDARVVPARLRQRARGGLERRVARHEEGRAGDGRRAPDPRLLATLELAPRSRAPGRAPQGGMTWRRFAIASPATSRSTSATSTARFISTATSWGCSSKSRSDPTRRSRAHTNNTT